VYETMKAKECKVGEIYQTATGRWCRVLGKNGEFVRVISLDTGSEVLVDGNYDLFQEKPSNTPKFKKPKIQGKNSKCALIDSLLKGSDLTRAEIAAEVVKQFPDYELSKAKNLVSVRYKRLKDQGLVMSSPKERK